MTRIGTFRIEESSAKALPKAKDDGIDNQTIIIETIARLLVTCVLWKRQCTIAKYLSILAAINEHKVKQPQMIIGNAAMVKKQEI